MLLLLTSGVPWDFDFRVKFGKKEPGQTALPIRQRLAGWSARRRAEVRARQLVFGVM